MGRPIRFVVAVYRRYFSDQIEILTYYSEIVVLSYSRRLA